MKCTLDVIDFGIDEHIIEIAWIGLILSKHNLITQ